MARYLQITRHIRVTSLFPFVFASTHNCS